MVGGVYTVSRVGPCRFLMNTLLALADDPNGSEWGYIASRFRKVTPEAADEFDRETIALLTGKPAQVPA